MLIILLDCSGSMGDPFHGELTFAGRATPAKAPVKIDAAKLALLDRLPGFGKSTIALFSFTSRARLLMEGQANEGPRIRQALDQLAPNNGTDIAEALREARRYAAAGRKLGVIQVLVVSDGLSDPVAAGQAAQELAGLGAIIHVILIDPTRDGEAVAWDIAIDGEVQAVTSAERLHAEIGEAVQEAAALQRRVEEAVSLHWLEVREVEARRGPEVEQVRFTVGYPGTVSAEPWYPFSAVIHLASLEQEVRARLKEQFVRQRLRGPQNLAEAGPDRPLTRGTEVTLAPAAEGLEFNPRSFPVRWEEDIQEVSFRFRARPGWEGKSVSGAMAVFQGDVEIAGVPFRVRVRARGEKDGPPAAPDAATAQVYRKVFASYNHGDATIVEALVAAYQALGIYVYLDRQSLRGKGGQEWGVLLRQFIEDSDLFHLYWSAKAMKSKHVEDEWRHARSLIGRKGETFIRGLTWEEPPPAPPGELSHLHFEHLNLGRFRGLAAPATPAAGVAGVAPVPAAPVIPLIPGTPVAAADAVRDDVCWAAGFLEQTTGLRYYVVPTLLVDEYLVREVRRGWGKDGPAAPRPGDLERAVALGEILGQVAMEVHLHFRHVDPPANGRTHDLLPMLASNYGFTQLDPFLCACEWVPRWMVWEPLMAAGYVEELTAALGKNICTNLDAEERGWKDLRGKLADAGTPGTQAKQDFFPLVSVFLGHLHDLIEGMAPHFVNGVWRSAHTVHEAACKLFREACAPMGMDVLSIDPGYDRRPAWKLGGPVGQLAAAARWAATELLAVLRRLLRADATPDAVLAAEVPTFGIFVPAGAAAVDRQLFQWAADRGVPRELTLPGQARVLLCLDALPRAVRAFQKQGSAAASDLARTLQRLVLVHEHAHAVFETGLDEQRRTAPGPGFPDAWDKANALNESLAVWMELEAVRGQAGYEKWVWDYIRGGEYPAWPYRGAEKVERHAAQHKLPRVRELLYGLRRDPLAAQAAFG